MLGGRYGTRDPKGQPQGQKRPADVVGAAIKVATGEIEEYIAPQSAAAELGRKGGTARPAKPSKKR